MLKLFVRRSSRFYWRYKIVWNIPCPKMTNEFLHVSLQAKNILTNPELRQQYEAWRSSGMSMKFKQWMAMKVNFKSKIIDFV